jgi:hypothetical protein
MKFFLLWTTQKQQKLKIYIFRSRHLTFLRSPKCKVFEHDFLHICGINSWLNANIFLTFLELN